MARRRSKKYQKVAALVDRTKRYSLDEALELIPKLTWANFKETVEAHITLKLSSNETVRGTVSLPYGTGKEVKVLVFARGEKAREAKESGADYVGDTDLIDKIMKENWIDFDVVIATPDMMRDVGKLGRILGPRGLMPSPKSGTVTMDVGKAVQEFKRGRIEFRSDKTGVVHAAIGKVDFPKEHLKANFLALYDAILKAKPQGHKGEYVRSAAIATTMGPGIKLDLNDVNKQLREMEAA